MERVTLRVLPFCIALSLAVAAGCSSAPPSPMEGKAEALHDADAPRPLPAVDSRPAHAAKQMVAMERAAPTGVPMAAPAPPPARMEAALAAGAAFAEARQREGDVHGPSVDGEHYAELRSNPIQRTAETPVSTFSIDVDSGSYANVRRMLAGGTLPPADAVRTEELLNYFDYGYQPPASTEVPFSVTTEVAPAPWNAQRHLLLVGIKGYDVAPEAIPASNLVFLVDTSGSMNSPDKLGLLKEAFALLVAQMRPQDRVAIVAYAGSAGLVLPSTPGSEPGTILAALDRLQAGGSTNGGAGIALAYEVAGQHFVEGGVNRVVLATDGDFNVGTVGIDALKELVAARRDSGVALTTLGFGTGNYNDAMAEQLADIGNGNHAYIDTLEEARKLLVDELSSTMLTIAQDVKIQVEFNPQVVAEYRLLGYENRLLRREDFANDRIDAGEIGAGHDVTALYEIVLVGSGGERIPPLRYGDGSSDGRRAPAPGLGDELAHLRLRYKQPGASTSLLIEQPIQRRSVRTQPSERLAFAAAVAGFAELLRGDGQLGDWSWAQLHALAAGAQGRDPFGTRAGFLRLVDQAGALRAPAIATIAD